MIKIIGLGPGASEALTLGTMKVLRNTKNVFFRTEKHPTLDFIKDEGIEFNTYDFAYEESKSFDDVYKTIAEDLIKKEKSYGEIVYGVPGHPLVAEKSVLNLIELCKTQNIEYQILPAVSFVDAMMESLKIDPIEGLKIIDAFDMDNQVLDKRIGTVITQVYNPFIASEVKLKLLDYYKDETDIYFVRAAGIKDIESVRKIKLYELDWQEDIDYLTSIYIPKDLNNKKDFYDLVQIIDKLRDEDGCLWDREQTHESLRKAIIEEAYEVVSAINKQDDDNLIEELGDVLLQVVFHSAIGKEDGFFNVNDVIEGICNKMIERHPHVFNNKELRTSEEVLKQWDEIKRSESGIKLLSEEMEKIAREMPSIIAAEKIQDKAKKVGFDWDKVEDAISKVEEELFEVKEVYNGENKDRIEEEMGDLLFSCINVARFLNVDCEIALKKTADKFIRRFKHIEKIANEQNKNLKEMTLEEMDSLWNEAKNIEK